MSIKIDQAFTNTLLTAGLLLDIVHEGGNYSIWNGVSYDHKVGVYTPTANRAFLEAIHFPAGKAEFSSKDSDEATGMFQVIVKYAADNGAFLAKSKAEEVLSAMKIGNIEYSGQKVFLTSNSKSGGRTDGGFYQITVRVFYRAFVAR